MRRYLPMIIMATLIVLLAGVAPARTLAVPEDYPTIASALNAAQSGDYVLVGCGTYRERNLRIKNGVSLWSATLQPDCTVIDAQGRGRVLVFDQCDSTTAVVGLTLRGGYTANDGGAVLCRNASPRLTRCRLENNHARHGGAVAASGIRGPILEDCVLVDNAATETGGGVGWQASGASRISRCRFQNNLAMHGGAVAMLSDGDLLLEASTLSNNTAGGLGGAIWSARGNLELRDCVLAGNDGGLGGSAMACRGTRPRLVGCTLVSNASDRDGGTVFLQRATLTAERSLLAFNAPASIVGQPSTPPDLSHCNIFGHPDGDWAGPLAPLADRHWNFSLDPQFCDLSRGNYDLRSTSPCLPGGRQGATSVLVGARSEGCP